MPNLLLYFQLLLLVYYRLQHLLIIQLLALVALLLAGIGILEMLLQQQLHRFKIQRIPIRLKVLIRLN